MRIAQRFNAGTAAENPPSPEGTDEPVASQPSLRDLSRAAPKPSVETLDYFRLSLRESDAGLVTHGLGALGLKPALLRLRAAKRIRSRTVRGSLPSEKSSRPVSNFAKLPL
jgi:hypothetical protein